MGKRDTRRLMIQLRKSLRKSSILKLKQEGYFNYVESYFGASLPVEDKELIVKSAIKTDLQNTEIPLDLYTKDIFLN